ncbi:hypothetical protein IHE44_0008754 [Lamprotornis superbus]|uniref:Acylphosphatase-2 n=1 Tax=Lamprotornis superbus TaxID=245042 RepID=A0A835TY16_9PASS|nr:hypothetical protein IHE44_0008754 [Lamprotornis superbus]
MNGGLSVLSVLTLIVLSHYFPNQYTEQEAKKLGVVGWVKNTSQGTVTGQVQGPEEKVNEILIIWTFALSSKLSFLEFAGSIYKLFCDYTQAPIVEVVVNSSCSAAGMELGDFTPTALERQGLRRRKQPFKALTFLGRKWEESVFLCCKSCVAAFLKLMEPWLAYPESKAIPFVEVQCVQNSRAVSLDLMRTSLVLRSQRIPMNRDVLLDLLIPGFCVEKSMVASPAILSLRKPGMFAAGILLLDRVNWISHSSFLINAWLCAAASTLILEMGKSYKLSPCICVVLKGFSTGWKVTWHSLGFGREVTKQTMERHKFCAAGTDLRSPGMLPWTLVGTWEFCNILGRKEEEGTEIATTSEIFGLVKKRACSHAAKNATELSVLKNLSNNVAALLPSPQSKREKMDSPLCCCKLGGINFWRGAGGRLSPLIHLHEQPHIPPAHCSPPLYSISVDKVQPHQPHSIGSLGVILPDSVTPLGIALARHAEKRKCLSSVSGEFSFICSSFIMKKMLIIKNSFPGGSTKSLCDCIPQSFQRQLAYGKQAVSTYRLLEVCLVMETLSRVQEGKASLTFLWGNIVAGSWEWGAQPVLDYPRLHPKLLKGEKQPLSRPFISINPCSSCLPTGQPLSGAVSLQPRGKALPRAPCGTKLQLCAIPAISGLGKSRDLLTCWINRISKSFPNPKDGDVIQINLMKREAIGRNIHGEKMIRKQPLALMESISFLNINCRSQYQFWFITCCDQKCHCGAGQSKRRRRLRSMWECAQRGDWGFWETSLKISPGKQIRIAVFGEAWSPQLIMSKAADKSSRNHWNQPVGKEITELNRELNTKQTLKIGSLVQESVLCLQDAVVDPSLKQINESKSRPIFNQLLRQALSLLLDQLSLLLSPKGVPGEQRGSSNLGDQSVMAELRWLQLKCPCPMDHLFNTKKHLEKTFSSWEKGAPYLATSEQSEMWREKPLTIMIHPARHRSQGDADWADLGALQVSASKRRKQHQKKIIYVAARTIMCWLSFLQGGRGKRIAVVGSFSLLVKERSTDRNVRIQKGTDLCKSCHLVLSKSHCRGNSGIWSVAIVFTFTWRILKPVIIPWVLLPDLVSTKSVFPCDKSLVSLREIFWALLGKILALLSWLFGVGLVSRQMEVACNRMLDHLSISKEGECSEGPALPLQCCTVPKNESILCVVHTQQLPVCQPGADQQIFLLHQSSICWEIKTKLVSPQLFTNPFSYSGLSPTLGCEVTALSLSAWKCSVPEGRIWLDLSNDTCNVPSDRTQKTPTGADKHTACREVFVNPPRAFGKSALGRLGENLELLQERVGVQSICLSGPDRTLTITKPHPCQKAQVMVYLLCSTARCASASCPPRPWQFHRHRGVGTVSKHVIYGQIFTFKPLPSLLLLRLPSHQFKIVCEFLSYQQFPESPSLEQSCLMVMQPGRDHHILPEVSVLPTKPAGDVTWADMKRNVGMLAESQGCKFLPRKTCNLLSKCLDIEEENAQCFYGSYMHTQDMDANLTSCSVLITPSLSQPVWEEWEIHFSLWSAGFFPRPLCHGDLEELLSSDSWSFHSTAHFPGYCSNKGLQVITLGLLYLIWPLLLFGAHGPRFLCDGLLELFQGQTSFRHWCNAREPGDEPIPGKVGQCASAVINGIQEGGGERLSQSFRLSGQEEDLLSDALDWLTININELFYAAGTCSLLLPVGLINNNLIINHMMWISEEGVYAVTSLNPTVSACEKAGMSKIRTRLMQKESCVALMSRLVGDAVINLLAYKSSGSASSPWQPTEQEMKSDMKSLTKESRMRVAQGAEKIRCIFFYLLLRPEYSCHE